MTLAVILLIALAEPVLAQKARELSRRERKDRIAQLAEDYRKFLTLVEPIITPEELNLFLLMESDAQRDRFIDDFWRRRDPDPKTVSNEYRERYQDRYEEAKKLFRSVNSDRGRIYLLNEPSSRVAIDNCRYLRRLEVWRYAAHPTLGREAVLLFYDTERGVDDFRLWARAGNYRESLAELLSRDAARAVELALGCPADPVQAVFHGTVCRGVLRRPLILECPEGAAILRLTEEAALDRTGSRIAKAYQPPPVETEGLGRVLRASVISNPNAPKLTGETSTQFGRGRGDRVSSQINVVIPAKQLKSADAGGSAAFHLNVAGETLKDEKVFETFQYRFDVPANADPVRLVVERLLHPNDYVVRLKVTDANSGAEGIFEVALTVPATGAQAVDAQTTATEGEPKVRILPIGNESFVTGSARIDTIVNHLPARAVEFYLDGKKLMTKRSPPFSVSLDFGPVPRTRVVRAVLLGANGEVIDADEMVVNVGADPFRLKIVSPRNGAKAAGAVRVEVEPRIPQGQTLQQIEILVNDRRAATLYSPPFVQTVPISNSDQITAIRAVATLSDPSVAPAEAVVFVNAPEYMQQIEVRLVEVPVTAIRDGRPVADLPREAFRLFDSGKPATIERFEYIRDLPLSLGLVIDTSGSMRTRLAEVQRAAALFLQSVMKSGDKAFVMSFDRHPQLLRRWSGDKTELATALGSMRAEEMTALHDALIAALYEFHGLRGQRALVLLSDGRDTASKFTFDQALEYARRAGVPIYAIGVGIRSVDIEAKPRLTRLANETGGSVFFLNETTELAQIYAQIEAELRSQYLLAFTPAATGSEEWREIRVEVTGATAKTIRGYYP